MRHTMVAIVLAAILAGWASPGLAVVSVGDPAPTFTKGVLGGGTASLVDHSGKVVVLFLLGYG